MQDFEFRQLVERIKLRSPIEVVVGERVSDLKKKGALYWARCPFHEERTPSFAVDPRRGTWRCYGACGEGGDVISFLERFDGVSFLDALRLLAQAAGEELPEKQLSRRGGANDQQAEARYELLRRAARLYRRFFLGSAGGSARAYASARGFEADTLEAFGIGWAPSQGSPLVEAATAAGFGGDLLVDTGLARRAEDGRLYDFFRGRLMVPIRDRLGRTVGFGGRLLPADEKADPRLGKYVNTPDTPLFHKGRLIFGLDQAADAVRKKRHLVLVEGYTDVMGAHQAGRSNVAAILGTSTTDEHAGLVRRTGAQRVTLLFDGDTAGERATLRALSGLLPLGIELRVASVPAGKDPCELFLSSEGRVEIDEEIENAPEWFAWTLTGLDGLAPSALGAAVDERFGLLARLDKSVERSARLAELATALGLPEDDVRTQWRAFHERRRPRIESRERPETPEPPQTETHEEPFELLIGALLLDNSLIPLYAELEERCPEGDLRTIFRALLHLHEHGAEDEAIDSGRIMTELADHPARRLVVLLEGRARTAESPELLARDQARWLERTQSEQELAELRQRLTRTVQSFEGGDAASDVLRSLHDKMRAERVPTARAPQPNR